MNTPSVIKSTTLTTSTHKLLTGVILCLILSTSAILESSLKLADIQIEWVDITENDSSKKSQESKEDVEETKPVKDELFRGLFANTSNQWSSDLGAFCYGFDWTDCTVEILLPPPEAA